MSRPRPIVVGPARAYAQAARGRKPGGVWYWRAVVHSDGTQRTVWTGWATAREVVQAVSARLDESPAPDPRDDEAHDLADVLELWLGSQMERRDIKPQTVDTQRAASQHAARLAGTTPAARVGKRTLEALRDRMMGEGYSTGTATRVVRAVRQAWRWAQEQGLVDPRPLPSIRIRHKPAAPTHTPSPAEVWRVLRIMREREPRWVVDVLTIMLGTGLRVGEAGGLRWADVRGDALHVAAGKTGRGRVVVMPPWLVAHVAAMPREAMRVIDRERVTVKQAVGHALRRFPWAECGLERWTSHALRRAAVDAMYRAGVDPSTAAAHLGHSPATALAHYRRASEGDLRAAVQAARLGEGGEVVPLRRQGGEG